MPPTAEPAVELANLVVTYPGRGARAPVQALRGLSLTAPRGVVTAVLGPNGAGKTTAVETCEGYRRGATGTATVLGLDPRTDGPRLRPRVGVMLQDGGVPGGATAAEVLRYNARLFAHPADVAGLQTRLGLAGLAGRPFRRLSGGEQQRVKLALALVGRPELVFLDEPTAGLDPRARHLTWDLIADLRTQGVSVVMTTHQMDEAEQLADHVVIVDAGVSVAAGPPRELTSRGSERSVSFRAPAALALQGLRAALPTGTEVTEDPPGSYRVQGSVDAALLATVTAWCAAQQVMPDGLTVQRRTLEDVFLELTGRDLG